MSRHPPQFEFSRPLKVDRVPRGGSYEKISAEPAECKALARRLDVPEIHALSAELRASPWRGGGLKLEGRLKADLDQVSVVSLTRFRHTVELPVLRYFLPSGGVAPEEDLDVDMIEFGHVDMGEVVSETLALELDPYPRQPGEEFAETPETPEPEPPEVSPFARLRGLKDG